MSKKLYRFELLQDGVQVASVEGPDQNRVHAEIFHYAMQYRQDGPCQIRGEGVEINFPARDDVPSVPVRWPTGNSR